MRYYRLIYYTKDRGEDYETNEKLITEKQFRQYQKAVAENVDYLVLEDRIIKRSSIKEIFPATELLSEYQKMGMPAKELGIEEYPQLEAQKEQEQRFTHIAEAKNYLSKKFEMLSPKSRSEAQEEAAKEERK